MTEAGGRLAALLARLEAAGVEASAGPAARLVHAHDGSTLHGAPPAAVCWPRDAAGVVAAVRACLDEGVPCVARGAGTGLSGGAIAAEGGLVIATHRLDRILSLDPRARRAVVQPGVANLAVSRAAAAHGLFYAPDPSSQAVCTLGGNVAHNSGGPHTLKLGVTVNHLLGLALVLPDGELVRVGGAERPGYDLLALLCGSEGTLGIVTEMTLRLLPLPAAVRTLLAAFPTPEEASRCVSAIVAGGVLPAAIEMLDAVVVEALEAAFGFRFPPGAGALLLLEVDGPLAEVEAQADALHSACHAHGALSVRLAADGTERAELWRARKRAFGALGRIARNYCTQDGVIPRTRLPQMLARVADVAQRHRLRIANVFHAGDGNLHPCILFDDRDADERERVRQAGKEILAACVELGGSLSGEHGIGVEKREAMASLFDPPSLAAMRRLRAAFDPRGLCNPGKLLPTGRSCFEVAPRRRQIEA